ncbi:MAG: SLAP domain-containing protein [Lactobacillaceae bacterium]
MNKNNLYKKLIVSLSGAALLAVGLSQMPNNVLNNMPVEVSAAKKTKVIGANSAIYRLKGKKMVKTSKVLKVGKKVKVSNKKTVKGKVYYKIGKNQYIKAVNVDGKKRKAAKKTVLYTRKGKVIKNSKIVKGQKVTIYGAAVTIKGKKYYSTRLGYIKASTLAKKKPAVNNDVEKPNENNTTPTNKPDSGNNTASANNSNSTSVPSTGGSSSTSPSVPTVDYVKAAKDQAVEDIKKAQDDAVNLVKSSPLTDDEKQTAVNQIEDIVKAALGKQKDGKSGAINDAKTVADVKKVVDETKAKCELVGNQIVSNDLVKQEGDFVKDAVAKMDDGDAKTAAPDKIAKAVKAANDAITSAKSQADLDKAETDFQNALNDAVPFAKQQEYAKDTINSAVTDAKTAINNDTTLSKDEKDEALSEIDAVSDAALVAHKDDTNDGDNVSHNIYDAKTTSDILSSINMVLATCEARKTDSSLKEQKDAAIKEINQAADDAIHTVTSSSASTENKQAAVDRINAIVKNALGEQKDGLTGDIHDAMSADEINTIKEQVTKSCELEGKKLASSELVSQVSDFASKSVAKMDDGDAKTAAPDKIAKAVKDAKDAIANAKSQADLDKAEADFQNALNDAVPFAKQQAYTVDSINNAVKAAKDRIKNDGLLTDSDKEEKLAQIDANAVVKAALGDQKDGTSGDVHDATTTNDLLLIQNSVITVCNQI